MGWFTNKSKDWEFSNLWYLLLSIVLPVFLPLAFVYIAFRAKRAAWLILSPVYLVLMVWMLSASEITSLIFTLLFIIWLSGIIILFLTRRDFLQRLDISTRRPIEWGRKYPYTLLDADGNPILTSNSSSATPLPVNLAFIANLRYWRKEIESTTIQENIDRMLEVAVIIHEKDSAASNIFFARHADTIDKMLRQYDDIENSALNTPVIQESKERIISVIETARKAFEQELTNMFKSEILDVSAESDAYIQNLRNRGLIE